MNLYQVADDLKNLSDQQLAGMMQNPSAEAPPYLVLSELTRRDKIRQTGQAQPPGSTVAEEQVAKASQAAPAPMQPAQPAQGQAGIAGLPGAPQQPPQPAFATGGPVDLRSIVSQTARRYGLPEDEFARVAAIESSWNPQAHNPNSSAAGLFQQIDDNWAQYGKGDRLDPAASADAAARFWLDNKSYLESKLGRALNPGELYLAHQQGAGNALKLLSNPNADVTSVIGRNRALLNGGAEGMTAGEFANKWISKAAGNQDPEAANMSYAGQDPHEDGIAALIDDAPQPLEPAPDDDFENYAGIRTLVAMEEADKANRAKQMELAQKASQVAPRPEINPEDYMPEKRAGRFAQGGFVPAPDFMAAANGDAELAQRLADIYRRTGQLPKGMQNLPANVPPSLDRLKEAVDPNSPTAEPGILGGIREWFGAPWVEQHQEHDLMSNPSEAARRGQAGATMKRIPAAGTPTGGYEPSTAPLPPPEETPAATPAVTAPAPGADATVNPDAVGGIEEIMQRLMAQRPDPYAEMKDQIADLTKAPDPEKAQWADLARFGFTLAATGDAGKAGLAVVDSRDKAQQAMHDNAMRQLELNAGLAKARQAAYDGDLDTASRLYTAQLEADSRVSSAALRAAARAKGAQGLKQETLSHINDAVEKEFATTDPLSPYATMPKEQVEALKENKRQQLIQWYLQNSGADGGTIGGVDLDATQDE